MCPYHLKIFKTLKYSNKLDINLKVEITWNWFKYCKKKRAKFCFKNKKTKEIWTIFVSHLANWEWINRTNHGKGKKLDLALRLQRFVLSTSFWFFSLHLAGIFQPCLCTSHLSLTQGNLSVMFSTFVWPVCYKFYKYCKQITQFKKRIQMIVKQLAFSIKKLYLYVTQVSST